MPDTLIIVFFVVLLAALLTYIIPMGQFDTKEMTYMNQGSEEKKTVLVPDSFHYVTDKEGHAVREGIPLFQSGDGMGFLNYVFEGLVSGDKMGSAVGVIAFILIIGGSFGIIMRTNAIDQGLMKVIEKTKGRESLLIPVMFVLFSLGGAVFGMGEEAIAFALILVPVIIRLGYDSITAVMITYVATQIGFASSWMNPFGVAIAQGISGVPVLSAAPFRILMWAVFTLFGVLYILRYAKKVKANPEASLSYKTDAFFRDSQKEETLQAKFGLGHIIVVLTLIAGIAWIIWGVVEHAYFIPEIATQFFVIGLVSGVAGILFKLNGMKLNDLAESFVSGAKDLLPAALVVGMAKGIVLVMGGDSPSDPSILNTILQSAGGLTDKMPAELSAWFMLTFQSVFNFFIVSGSGQAALTMPLMAPLADIAGVTRQVAVVAFQLGDGLTNIIVPTSAALMGTLGAARMGFGTWLKFIYKFQILLFVLASVFVLAAAIIKLH